MLILSHPVSSRLILSNIVPTRFGACGRPPFSSTWSVASPHAGPYLRAMHRQGNHSRREEGVSRWQVRFALTSVALMTVGLSGDPLPRIDANDNRTAAGHESRGVLRLH